MSITDETTFAAEERKATHDEAREDARREQEAFARPPTLLEQALTCEREGLLDALRAGERDAWHAFASRPTMAARKEHFEVLMALLRELDSRAEALLGMRR